MTWIRPRTALAAVGIVAILVGGAAYAVLRSQEDGRRDLRNELAARAEQAGRFTIEALLSPNEASAAKIYFGGPDDAVQAAVDDYQSQDPLPRVVILDARGRVLGADPPATDELRERLARDPMVRAALRGRAGVSDVFTGPDGEPAFDVATPFQTEHGSRVQLQAAPVSALQGALGGYLPSAPAVRGGRAYLIDARGRVVAASTEGNLGQRLPDSGLRSALSDSTSGTHDGRYFVAVPIGHNGWRALFTAPTETLYASVEGSRRVTAWLLFSALTLALLGLLGVGATTLYRSARLAHERLHDPLTGLPTRALFIDRVDRALAGVHRRELPAAVLFIDLDRFKQVNDRFGHAAGDQVLQETARRLREVVRWIDTLSRLGGDEFLVLCEELADEEEAARIASRIQETLARPVGIGRHEVTLGCSIGIAVHRPSDAPISAARLMHNADVAMYHAKRGGGSRMEVFEAGLPAEIGVLELDPDLDRAAGVTQPEAAARPSPGR